MLRHFGTALTENQGRLLRQYSEEVVLSYDSDEAGQKAIERGLEVMSSLGVTAKVLQMEGAKDPDEYVLKYGPIKFEKLINNSISLIEYKVKKLEEKYNLDDTDDKIKFLNKMAEILSKVENNIERDIYIEKLSKEVGVGKEAIIAEIDKITFKGKAPNKPWDKAISTIKKENVENNSAVNMIEEMVIYLLSTKDNNIYTKISKCISLDDIQGEQNRTLISRLYQEHENGNITNIDVMNLCKTDDEFNLLSKILIKNNMIENKDKACEETLRSFSANKFQTKKKKLIENLQNATTEEERKLYEKELNDLILTHVSK